MNTAKTIGKGTYIWNPELSNIQQCTIGEDCRIHSNVWIGDDVVIGNRCKVQAMCFIPTGVTLGDEVFLGPGVVFTNDKHPPSGQWSNTVVEDGVSIGANATILPGITLHAGCRVGAGSVVTKDVPSGVVVCGNPAKIHNKKL
jgi:acetyltransferase-like isoleucine patch superfamily enzyme